MKQGTVLFHRDFTFDDGQQADKLLIVLSQIRNGQLLAAKTTSQKKSRPTRDGCHIGSVESLFTFNANLGGFRTTTWVVLQPYVLAVADLMQRHFNQTVHVKFYLKDVDLRAVVNCMRKCDDISPHHLSFLN